jgi:hypothetical protein
LTVRLFARDEPHAVSANPAPLATAPAV